MSFPPSRPCAYPDCWNNATEGEWCYAHARQRRRGDGRQKPLRDDRRTPWDVVYEAAIALGDADTLDDKEFARLKQRFRMAMFNYVDASERSKRPRKG